jgi:hypothetical protein
MKANYLMKKSDRTVISLWTKNLTVDPPDLRTSKEKRTLPLRKRLQREG